jgi:hypothetical protein
MWNGLANEGTPVMHTAMKPQTKSEAKQLELIKLRDYTLTPDMCKELTHDELVAEMLGTTLKYEVLKIRPSEKPSD